jgi:hypothetical protein
LQQKFKSERLLNIFGLQLSCVAIQTRGAVPPTFEASHIPYLSSLRDSGFEFERVLDAKNAYIFQPRCEGG